MQLLEQGGEIGIAGGIQLVYQGNKFIMITINKIVADDKYGVFSINAMGFPNSLQIVNVPTRYGFHSINPDDNLLQLTRVLLRVLSASIDSDLSNVRVMQSRFYRPKIRHKITPHPRC